MLIQMNTAPANKPLELEAAMSQARDFLAQYYGDTNHWDICNNYSAIYFPYHRS